jgi:hypothetical protein
LPLSRNAVERRITTINEYIETNPNNEIENRFFFNLALDESIDILNFPRLTIFIRFVNSEFIVKEELLDFVVLKELTRVIEIKETLDVTLDQGYQTGGLRLKI